LSQPLRGLVGHKTSFETNAPALGAAGLSLSLAGGVSAANGSQAADALRHNTIVSHEIMLDEEEITEASLATFYVFDKETPNQRSTS
jgi:hypothetical protein